MSRHLIHTALAVALTLSTAFGTSDKQPNIILVFIDDMGWGDFSCFGNTEASTPHIDRMAKEGIAFEQFYVNSPICSPSRTAITTGQYPQRWKITSFLNHRQDNKRRGMAQWLDPKAPVLARFLKQAGYTTGHFGKWHLGGQRDVGEAPLITKYGFDESLTNFEGLGPRVIALKNTPKSKKPARHAMGSDTLGRGEIQYVDRSEVTATFTAAALDFVKRAEASQTPFYLNLWPDDVHTPAIPHLDQWGDGKNRTLYHAVLQNMDAQFAPLFDYIRNNEKLRDNTIVLICSDNGPEVGYGSPGPFKGSKATLFEAGIRSPLIVWAPGLIPTEKKGSRNTTSVFSAIDLIPSLLEITQTSAQAEFDGENISATLLGKSQASRHAPLFFRRPPDRTSHRNQHNLPDLAIRSGQWKLLCDYDGSTPRLFNLTTDPGESTNLAGVKPELAKKLAAQILKWHASMPADLGPELERK
ncbi:MAG: sulfatase-like hydrolase/transferase [Opitutales bacterium]|jgi:arylsulfatase A-like enzyme|nr:sulfatase-like hydrolase/transferase [Opitutales bacterium]MDP4896858.1 sulfatase-like hydrolase/transferase [Akkermansiaceae bacterium]MDP5080487.1 sulfatase-like hydrolase/transferase [Opitutales bacterium]